MKHFGSLFFVLLLSWTKVCAELKLMKQIKFIIILLAMFMGGSAFSYEGVDVFTGNGEASGASTLDVVERRHARNSEIQAKMSADDWLKKALEESGVNGKTRTEIQQMQQQISAATPANLAEVVEQVNHKLAQCVRFVESGSRCCAEPAACGGGGNVGKVLDNVKGFAPLLAMLGGEAAGAAKCLAVMPSLTSGLGLAKGASRACRMIRDGAALNMSDGSSIDVPGCVEICGDVQGLANALLNKANILVARIETQRMATQLANEAKRINTEANKYVGRCRSNLTTGEAKADEQAKSNQQSADSAMACACLFTNSDSETAEACGKKKPPGDVASKPKDCKDPTYKSQNPGICNTRTVGQAGDSSFKTSSSSDSVNFDENSIATDPNEGLDDPLLGQEDGDGGSGESSANDGLSRKAGGGAGGGFLGGLSGSGGASQKARRGGKRKSKSLVSGYANGRGGSSGSSARSPSGFKGWKNKFKKNKKNANKKNKKALSALSKLIKAGISPKQSESIFARVSNRFVSSSAKENMFDAKRNKKQWMQE